MSEQPTVAELRAVLRPLLDDPTRQDKEGTDYCLFCDRPWPLPGEHAPDCPVLRRDALLGVDRTAPTP